MLVLQYGKPKPGQNAHPPAFVWLGMSTKCFFGPLMGEALHFVCLNWKLMLVCGVAGMKASRGFLKCTFLLNKNCLHNQQKGFC